MNRSQRLRSVAIALILVASAATRPAAPAAAARDLPAQLSNAEYWKLIEDFSEPGGSFRSDNLLSNEIWFQHIVPDLTSYLKESASVYLGVGPEQNFTYIAALQPKMVIIFDVRRGNLHTQMMYKALFELAATRADFVSLLFSRPRPEGLSESSTVSQIFTAIAAVPSSQERYAANLKTITDHLTKTRGLALTGDDLAGIDYVYGHFYRYGPGINYNSSTSGGGFGRGAMSTYQSLMTATDAAGVSRGFLADEKLFGVLKGLHMKNLILPVVGDFAGPKAIRAVGKYLRTAGATVTAFYLSNVEQYLQGTLWQSFCNNVASLPLTETSTFIYSEGGGGRGGGGGLGSYYRPILADVKSYKCSAGSGWIPGLR
jgi:hypothetical protein